MRVRIDVLRVVLVLSVFVVAASQVAAQGGPPWAGRGGGRGQGRGGPGGGIGRGPAWARQGRGRDEQFATDRDVFHYLLQNHEQICREVKNTESGVETTTESESPDIAAKIQEHVAAMAKRVEERRPIHMRDPLFAEVFRHADEIHLTYEKTAKGIRVVETSDNPYVVQLIQAHGGVVSLFVKNGFSEARTNHAVPGRQAGDTTVTNTSPVPGRARHPRAGCPLHGTNEAPPLPKTSEQPEPK